MKRVLPALLLTLCLLPPPAWAGEAQAAEDASSIVIWGIKQGCTVSSPRTEAVRRYLRSLGYPAAVLNAPPASPECQGEACVRLLQKSCPSSHPRILLGGRVEEVNKVVRIRLWMHDYTAQKTAYHDEFCANCEMDQALTLGAAEIIERPRYEAPPDATPIYCQVAPAATPMSRPQEACAPYVACGGPDDASLLAAPAPKGGGMGIDPKRAKLVKGAVWGGFALSAAATLALVIANFTAPLRDPTGTASPNPFLLPAIYATSTLTVLSLGVAIPTTIVVDRATAGQPASGPGSSSVFMHCPN